MIFNLGRSANKASQISKWDIDGTIIITNIKNYDSASYFRFNISSAKAGLSLLTQDLGDERNGADDVNQNGHKHIPPKEMFSFDGTKIGPGCAMNLHRQIYAAITSCNLRIYPTNAGVSVSKKDWSSHSEKGSSL